ARRIAGRNHPGRNIPSHYRTHANDAAITDLHTIDNATVGTNPDITTNANTTRGHRLLAHPLSCLHAMIERIQGAARRNAGVITDLDTDPTAIQRAAVIDADVLAKTDRTMQKAVGGN